MIDAAVIGGIILATLGINQQWLTIAVGVALILFGALHLLGF